MQQLASELYQEIVKIPLIDPHSHINPLSAASTSLNDLLGYHYYTELAHSAGLPKERIESATGYEQAERIVDRLRDCANTIQVCWLIDLAQTFFGFADNELTTSNLRGLFDSAGKTMAQKDWTEQVFQKTNLEAIFLTNDFDDPLEGFDVRRYIPCLRTDDLVFKLDQSAVRDRFEKATGLAPTSWSAIGAGIDKLFQRFVQRNARACAISLPPDFAPERPSDSEAETALSRLLKGQATDAERRTVGYAVFYALADRCETFKLPFDLMIGVWRGVYPAGVYQGQDLLDKTTSLYQFRRLFNDKSKVVFPISVLTHNQNPELVAYSWIFPNVVTSGHWWYSNIPSIIEADTRARLEAVPQSKQIGYYSDAYKLEFVLPKFNMYRRCLANVLATDFVIGRGWTEARALSLARTVLRDNVERIFPSR